MYGIVALKGWLGWFFGIFRLGRCSEAENCVWAVDVAVSQGDAVPAHQILLESACRWCAEEVGPEALENRPDS